ncbi:hypothetical protein FISHEDRAFT_66962 [Fistulina hepatica ATCC 64428]|uniref:DNA mismatch repair proteins mutS family domain-containing protein n=1 Tax=Fistulina hepatica ATCC 64428 TaxID=1128425 RepID=A0A0D7A652_9AGAR|nr:hypothetical protein FISHEDRAFT_66962 [Fistulina hepatica ATCC 64428]
MVPRVTCHLLRQTLLQWRTSQYPRVAVDADANGIIENLKRFPHCLLLTRVGSFYESYFSQATDIARLLSIKLTSRKIDGHRVPMCGFPLQHLDKYLKVLVQQHKRLVAMCEEFPVYSPGAKIPSQALFERRVTRVITPGTLIDEIFLNQYENNFLLAIAIPEMSIPAESEDAASASSSSTPPFLTVPIGLAWIDVSTGEFFSKAATIESLRDELARIQPREVVLNTSRDPTQEATVEKNNVFDSALEALAEDDHFFTPQEAQAVGLLTSFMRKHLLEHMPVLSLPNREHSHGRMHIDAHTIKALEIRENAYEGGTRGSLLSVIKRTVTMSGTRLLARWLCSPSTSLAEVNARQSLVAFFFDRPHFRFDLHNELSKMDDASRILQRFLMGRGDSGDLLALNTTIQSWHAIRARVDEERRMEALERPHFDASSWAPLDTLTSRMHDLRDLSRRIVDALEIGGVLQTGVAEEDEAGDEPVVLESGNQLSPLSRMPPFNVAANMKWTIKPGFSEELTELHMTLRQALGEKDEIEQQLQLKYDAPSLTLRSSPGLGMHVHLARRKRDQRKLDESPDFVSIFESASTKSYFYQPWSQIGNNITETNIKILTAEREAFDILRREVPLRRNARVLDELDVTLAFACLATEMNLVRPKLTEDTTFNIVRGRHPTVELGLLSMGRTFTPNSISMSASSRLHVITGPNMAGKSTYLRQAALIAILAQTGSFVPADSAEIGLVDRVFSRVGARDDLFHDRSTFMVEMLETAEILRRATPKSLVIMDEVGRGTTVKDGLAISFAALHHLVTVNRCRGFFATHFHELADMVGYSREGGRGVFQNMAFFCSDLVETEKDGHFAYTYHIRPGVNSNSHGLKVAKLAGMPPSSLEVARLIWEKLAEQNNKAWDTDRLYSIGQTIAQATQEE